MRQQVQEGGYLSEGVGSTDPTTVNAPSNSPRKTTKLGRIRTKLIGAFLIVVLVPLVGTGVYGNWITSRTLTERALETFQHDLNQRARGIQGHLNGVSNDTLYLSTLPSLQALLLSRRVGDAVQSDLSVGMIGQDFLQFALTHPGLTQIRYIDEVGQEWVRVNSRDGAVSVVPGSQLQNKANRYYFRQTMELEAGKVFVSQLDLNKELGVVEIPYRPVMRYATPVSFMGGEPAGLVIVNVNAQDILDLVQGKSDKKEEGFLALVNQEDFYLAHPDSSRLWGGPTDLGHGHGMGMDYAGLNAELLSEGDGFIFLNEGSELPRSPWARGLTWAEGLVLGSERVLVFQTVRPAGEASETFWILLRDEPRTTIFSSVWSFRFTAAAILAGAVLVASLIAVALARGLTAPILTLTQGARRLAEGQLQGPIEVTSDDEMGELAKAFNEMAVALQRNLERLTLLNRGGQHIAARLEQVEVQEAILDAVGTLIGGDCRVISLKEKTVENAVVAMSSGNEAWLSRREEDVVLTTLQEAIDENTWRTVPIPSETGPPGYLCCAPLCIGLERQGLVEVYGIQESLADPTTGSLLVALANQGSIALEKADLIQQLRNHRTELENLVERLIRAQEEERRVVAYDIHDGLVQMLVGVRLHLSNYVAQRRAAAPEAEATLQKGLEQLAAAVAEARRVIEGLRPIALDELGLEATLRQYAQDLAEDTGWDLEFHADPTDLRATPVVETTAFRIAQEALTNARKHSDAQRVRVSLSSKNGTLIVEVRDWGRGFDPEWVLANQQSIGLAGIRERARLLRGECIIDSQPGVGTSVKVSLPIQGEGK